MLVCVNMINIYIQFGLSVAGKLQDPPESTTAIRRNKNNFHASRPLTLNAVAIRNRHLGAREPSFRETHLVSSI